MKEYDPVSRQGRPVCGAIFMLEDLEGNGMGIGCSKARGHPGDTHIFNGDAVTIIWTDAARREKIITKAFDPRRN